MIVHEVHESREGESPPHPRGGSYTSTIDAVKSKVTVLELAESLVGSSLVRKGSTYTARCPLPDHDDGSPSFTVYADNGRGWTCFGCGRGGDVVHLYAHAEGVTDMRVAAAELLMAFGHEVPQRPPSWFRRQERQAPLRDAIHRERVEHIRLLVFRLIWVPWLRTLPPWVKDEAKASAWDSSWSMAQRLYTERRSA